MQSKFILNISLSLLLASGALHAATGEPHNLTHTVWFSHSERIFRHVDIYVPECLVLPDTTNLLTPNPLTEIPVLYLIHGINGYEGAWQERGSAIDTLNAMIADGRCRPMILVMPDCSKWPRRERPLKHYDLWKCLFHYPRLSREHLLEHALSDLIDMIDSTYCVSTCAVAGLSDGGRMAANIANLRSDRISTVGLFSPVLYNDQLPAPDSILSTLNIQHSTKYYIYIGSTDNFCPNGKRFHRRMTRAGNQPELIRLKGGHNWNIWRQCLSDFLEKL